MYLICTLYVPWYVPYMYLICTLICTLYVPWYVPYMYLICTLICTLYVPWYVPYMYLDMYLIMPSVKQGSIFWVFDMTQPGIELRSPRLLANTLTIMSMSGLEKRYSISRSTPRWKYIGFIVTGGIMYNLSL